MFAMLMLVVGCVSSGPEAAKEPADESASESGPVVIYSGRSASVVDPLIEALEAATELEIEVQYGGTPELASRMLAEGAESPADLFFAQDPGYLGLLAERDALAPLPPQVLEPVDARFRDDGGRWVGTSGRLRTLVVDSAAVPPEQRPRSLQELADPRWKGRLGWAPANSSFQAHISGLRHAWGERRLRQWLEAVIANEPRRFPKNSPQVKAANVGEIALGWVNHYYLYRVDAQGRRAVNHSFPEEGREGNLMMVAGVGIRAGSPRPEAAAKVAAWLVSEVAQQRFVEGYEYPTRKGVPAHPEVPALEGIPLAELPQQHLSDIAPTQALLQELSLL